MRFRLGLVELAPDSTGGAATYGRAMREILSRLSEELTFDLIRLVNESSKSSISGLDDSVVTYRKWAPPVSPWRRLFFGAVGQSQKQRGQNLPQVLEDESIDLVWFLAPNQVIEQVRDVPFVMTVWDLAHREVQGFPEFNSGRGWSRRESWYINNIGRAFHVVTDSIQSLLSITEYRRRVQTEHNEKHGIIPHTVTRSDQGSLRIYQKGKAVEDALVAEAGSDVDTLAVIRELEGEMQEAAAKLEFERAALIRDQINKLKKEAGETPLTVKKKKVKY